MCSVLLSFDLIFMQVHSTRNTSKNCDNRGLESNMEIEIFKNEGIKMKIESSAGIM